MVRGTRGNEGAERSGVHDEEQWTKDRALGGDDVDGRASVCGLCVGKHFSSNTDDLHAGNEDIMWKGSVSTLVFG